MKRLLTIIFLLTTALTTSRSYNDYRGHKLDSLERVVARWTPEAVDKASTQELLELNRNYRDLMLGYSQINREKFYYYTRKALQISRKEGWESANADALRYLGQYFYAQDRYDSALVYFNEAIECTDRMEAGATSPTNPGGYSELDIDDIRSALYGSIGNLYNVMDSIPKAMEYYEKAGAIFDKYGWNESNSILYYNIGETWMETDEFRKAITAYEKALDYATRAGDSLFVANAQKGLGRAYMEQGKTWKALNYLHKADEYYSSHEKEELPFIKENYEYMSAALMLQRRQFILITAGLLLIILLVIFAVRLGGKLRLSRKEKAEVTAVLEEAIDEMGRSSTTDAPSITEREKEILDLLSKGYTTPEIAEGISLSPETVKWYRKKLLVKFDVSNTAELVTQARDLGII